MIIEELPEHEPLVKSLVALKKAGMAIVVPEKMIQEACSHIERTMKSYSRVRSTLHLLAPDYVDAEVWHAIVRGYYYYLKDGGTEHFAVYWQNYYVRDSSQEFIEFIINKRIECRIERNFDIEHQDAADLELVVPKILQRKEQRRSKAQYRHEEQQEERTRADLKCGFLCSEQAH